MSKTTTDLNRKKIYKKGSKFNKLIIILMILIYIFLRTAPIVFNIVAKTETVVKDIYYETIKTEGNIILNETVYSKDINEVEKYKEDLSKVRKNDTIANQKGMPIVGREPGIVSYYIDGNEKEIAMSKTNIKEIKKNLSELDKDAKTKDGIKTINGQKWYIYFQADIEEYNLFRQKKESETDLKVNIRNKENDKMTLYSGKIKELIIDGGKAQVLLESTKDIHKVINMREVSIEIVKNSYSGLLLPPKSITEKDKKKGVYVKSVGDIVTFIPVNIIYRNKEVVVAKLEETGSIKTKKEDHKRALKIYDEVFSDSSLVREYQKVR